MTLAKRALTHSPMSARSLRSRIRSAHIEASFTAVCGVRALNLRGRGLGVSDGHSARPRPVPCQNSAPDRELQFRP
jgi:hypothetical protein